jgi:hypothetical protein
MPVHCTTCRWCTGELPGNCLIRGAQGRCSHQVCTPVLPGDRRVTTATRLLLDN